MIFESYTNLLQPSKTLIKKEIEYISITEPNTSYTTGNRAEGRVRQGRKIGKQTSTRGNSRKRAGTVDQFCIYQLSDSQRILVVSIEYKPPYKLPLAQVIAGLKGEIHPAKEVINREGKDFDFLSKSLITTMITQLFSYIIRKSIQQSYIFIREAIIFLYIPDDPTIICYYLSIPYLDF